LHIPDGFIPWWQCIIYYIILAVALYFSLKWARKNLDEKLIPLMAVLAAGIFAIMSINAPIFGTGTSGHMVGGALVAIVFCAPEAAVIIFTLVLLVQALYGDGGITALGANVLNMGIIGGFVGLYTFKALRKPIGKIASIAIASWLAIFLAAEAVAVEMWLAGIFPLGAGLVTMGFYHALIGIIEAVLTVVVILALEKLRPDLLAWNRNKKGDDLKSEAKEAPANEN